jgi:hypothetical protein
MFISHTPRSAPCRTIYACVIDTRSRDHGGPSRAQDATRRAATAYGGGGAECLQQHQRCTDARRTPAARADMVRAR